jgi:GTP-binding protein
MVKSAGLPIVVIVGRPNVGKSTFFNAVTGTRRSIVHDEPGITRDRISGITTHRGRKFEIIDTGGIIPDDHDLIPSEILKQAKFALEAASWVVFLIDGRTEITSADRDLAKMLKKLGKPVVLAVNKIDTEKSHKLTMGFYELGIEPLFAVSSEHKVGIHELLDYVTEDFPIEQKVEVGDEEPPEVKKIKVAIIGRPNVGKSTLINAVVGSERSIVSPVAGTTRDSVDETVQHGGTDFVFVDTAGIRRKGKTVADAEKLSVVMAQRNIRMANVALIIIDASEGIMNLDAHIAGYAHEAGRAIIIVVNKWDIAPNKKKADFEQKLRDELKFLEFAQIAFISAKNNLGITQLYDMIEVAYKWSNHRVTTGELNRFCAMVELKPDTKIKYVTQASLRPPTFVVFTDRRDMHFSAERQLVNLFRKHFGYIGTPIVIKHRPAPKRKPKP